MVVRERWRPHPLAWIHRGEARGIAGELGAAGRDVRVERLRFLECDVAPLVGTRSAFAASLAASGIARAEQLRLLLNDR
jgi:hypothetical protein